MAISDSKKLDFLWKKLGYGVAKTDDTNKKSASNESISSPLIIRGDRVWVDSDQIPAVLPSVSDALVEVYNDFLSSTVECQPDNTSTPLRTWKTNLGDWIPPEFGPTYTVKVYVATPANGSPTTGTRLYPDGTGSDEWFFDYAAGVLHFIGDSLPASVIAGKSIYITGARYIGRTGLGDVGNGSGVLEPAVYPEAQAFTADGTTSAYQLTYTPASNDMIDVYVDDVLQRPGEAFTINGDNLQFLTLPSAGTDVYIKFRAGFVSAVDLPPKTIENHHLDLTYSSDQYSGDGSQTTYGINPGHTVHSVLVIVNGLIIPPQQYTVNGTILTLNTSPTAGAIVDIRYMPV